MYNKVCETIRIEENYYYGSFGVFTINKEVFCVTLEPRDEENAPNISSIPAQQYICRRKETSIESVLRLGFNETFYIMDVPDRTNCAFHPGNTADHTLGCTILAQYFGKLHGDRAVLNSGNTFKAFMNIMEDENEFLLTVKECY